MSTGGHCAQEAKQTQILQCDLNNATGSQCTYCKHVPAQFLFFPSAEMVNVGQYLRGFSEAWNTEHAHLEVNAHTERIYRSLAGKSRGGEGG
jgi:hypothetical protein